MQDKVSAEMSAATSSAPMTINIKCIDSSTHPVTVRPVQTIGTLKLQLSKVISSRNRPAGISRLGAHYPTDLPGPAPQKLGNSPAL